jgi:rhodanese-related sulfurtransferase
MPVDIHSEEGKMIRQLIPLSTISANQFESLCTKITVEVAEASTFLFKTSDSETDLIYLIDGSITLQSSELKIETIQSGTESSRFALAHQIPRKIDALTNTSVRFLRLNTSIIDTLPRNSFEEEENNYMVIDEPENENDADWMTTLLKSPIFRALPPANLQKIIIGLEEVSFEKGELIIKQGDPGDFYYLIKKGHCLISRKPSANAKDIKLAQLRTQDTFGEDSLISGEPRNVSITALTDISLLRLSKEKFISLIKKPSIKYIPHSEIAAKLGSGAFLLDVRTPDEYKKHHLPNSINEPFFSLRMQIKTFDRKKDILVICANGKTSEAATFLLLRHKLNAFVVESGMEQASHEDIYSSTSDDNNDLEKTTAPEVAAPATTKIPADEESSQDSQNHENQELKLMLKQLTKEKEELEKKYLILYKQSEKLKAVLDTLQIGGGEK